MRQNHPLRAAGYNNVKMILALGFALIADVPAAFDDLVDSSPSVMAPLADYWEDIYCTRQRRWRCANPRFALQLWNVRNCVVDKLPRTNKSVKAWHHSFQQTVNCHHPSDYKLAEHFRQEQDRYEVKIMRFHTDSDILRHPRQNLNQWLQALAQHTEQFRWEITCVGWLTTTSTYKMFDSITVVGLF